MPRIYLFVSDETIFHPPILHEILERRGAEVVGAAIFPRPRHASAWAGVRQALALDGGRAVPRLCLRWLAHRWACVRHSPPNFVSVARVFDTHKILLDRFANPNHAQCVARVKALRTEVVLNFQPWYLRAPVLSVPTLACLNLHTAALPKYRGVEPVIRALLAGENVVGVSIHTMEEAIDAGVVLAQTLVPARDCVFDCYKAAFAEVPVLVERALALLESHGAPVAHSTKTNRYFSHLTRGEIDAFREAHLRYL